MSESFTLRGSRPEGRERRPIGSWIVLALIVVGVIWLVVRGLQNPTTGSPNPQLGPVYQSTAARVEAFRRVIPAGRVPDPYFVRGAVERDGFELVWLHASFADSHAFLLSGPFAPREDALKALVERLGTEFLPPRQLIDEEGVLPERRRPFVEEFREPADLGQPKQPPRGWVTEWSEAASFRRGADVVAPAVETRLSDDLSVLMSLHRRDGEHWWAAVDLEARAPAGRKLYLVHAVRGERAAAASTTFDFVSALLQVR